MFHPNAIAAAKRDFTNVDQTIAFLDTLSSEQVALLMVAIEGTENPVTMLLDPYWATDKGYAELYPALRVVA